MNPGHLWCERLLAPLPDALIAAAVPADDGHWEYVESELVKLGTLAHSQVDLAAVSEAALVLLETRCKDMRVLVQLLRCLQHPAKADGMAMALELLTLWLRAYWGVAWPASQVKKLRLMQQIIKRFEGVWPRIVEVVSPGALDELQARINELNTQWVALLPEQEQLLTSLLAAVNRACQRQVTSRPAIGGVPLGAGSGQESRSSTSPDGVTAPFSQTQSRIDTGSILDCSSERAWRQTQLNVAEQLIERHPDSGMGYRLRRHAIWSTIISPPLSQPGGRTQLAPMPVGLVDDYRAGLVQPDMALWQRIEQSLILSPYWFTGHHLSALVAQKLGYVQIAQAIAQELSAFISRLPALVELTFADGSLFFPAECRQWLRPDQQEEGEPTQRLATRVIQCHQELGLDTAMRLLDEQMSQMSEPRSRFYTQLLQAELLDLAGMASLAAESFAQLWREADRLGLLAWEPGLVNRLECRISLAGNES